MTIARLSGDNRKSCVSCHSPDDAFASGRVIKDKVVKLDRNTLSLFNVRFKRWFGWDGRNDNLWAQSIRPIIHHQEMNLPKEKLKNIIQASTFYKPYQSLFGEISTHSDDLVLVNIGKALAAFQETLVTGKTAFDHFRDAVANADWAEAAKYPKTAQRGLSLFLGRGNCVSCHSGALFTSGEFHDVAVPSIISSDNVDSGRWQGIIDFKKSPFTLASEYNDDPKKTGTWSAIELDKLQSNASGFRTPSLRNLTKTAPYMHNGAFSTLEAVVEHYSTIDTQHLSANSKAILKPLNLSPQDKKDLVAFLKSLSE